MPEIRIILDRDCPGCGWPEVIASGDMLPEQVQCGRRKPCGYTAPASEWTPTDA